MEPGSSLAHYRLIDKIGEGGVGQVFKALDTRLDREVAIKVLNAEFSSDERRLSRFEREAKLLASINHPNIATIYGLDEQDGQVFIAMELIPGEDLSRRLDRGRPSLVETLRIARQIAGALEATHARGVIHRDLKPANVQLTPGGDIKVLDFGIARDAEQPGGDSLGSGPTRPGSILGTVSYMSPEQARGKPVDGATDLWAFGCVVYRMLSGTAAFPGDTRWDRLASVLREEPDWDALPGDTPPLVVELIKRCLAKDRSKRLDDAGVARRMIESVLGESTISSETGEFSELSTETRTWKTPAIRWVLLAALVAVAGWWGYRTASGTTDDAAAVPEEVVDRSLAVLPFENRGGAENVAFTVGIHDDILNRVAKIGDLRVISRTSVMEYGSTTLSVREIGEELGVAAILEGGIQRAGDQVRINLQLIDTATEQQLWAESFDREVSAEQIFAIQSEIAGQVADALKATMSAEERRAIDHLPTSVMPAYEAYLEGLNKFYIPGQLADNLKPARRLFREATELDPEFALAYAFLSRAARDHHWLGGGEQEALDEALEAASRALEIAPGLPEAHLALGTYLYMTRDYDAALEELRIAEQGLPSNSEVIRWKAYIVRRRGGWDEALRDLQRARSLDPRDVEAIAEVGFTLLTLRRYDEAELYYREALDLISDYPAAKIYGLLLPFLRDGTIGSARRAADGIADVAPVPWKYAHGWQTLISARDFERAAVMAAAPGRIVGQWHDYPSSLLIGWTYRLEGRGGDAAEEFEAARLELEADLVERPDDARLHVALGIAYAGLGRHRAAVASGLKAVRLMPIAKDTFVGTWLLQDLGWIYVMVGEYDEAVDIFNRILEVPSIWSIELLRADPRSDPLHDHPGFKHLVDKYGRA